MHQLYLDETLSYPYSVRELVNVVKHLSTYPSDGVASALDNALAMDTKTGNSPHAAAAIRQVALPLTNLEPPNAALNPALFFLSSPSSSSSSSS